MQNRLSLFAKLFWNVLGLSNVMKCAIRTSRSIAFIFEFITTSTRFR